jgi:hypothetical protein
MKTFLLAILLAFTFSAKAQDLYEIKIIECMTDDKGKFTVTDPDFGFNIMQWGQYDQQDEFRGISEFKLDPSDNTTNRNITFEQLVGYYSRSLDEIYNCLDCRLYGTKIFVARDGGGAIMHDALVKVVVVYWKN